MQSAKDKVDKGKRENISVIVPLPNVFKKAVLSQLHDSFLKL